jgi:drug/metabolite transporter (DMT)-like permease
MTGSTEILIAAANEGGGRNQQVIGMTVVAVIIGALLLWIGYLHRAEDHWVNSFAEWTGRRFKRPPVGADRTIATIICALFGFIWDVSLHIGKGRDPGPLANPAHYFILVGLFLLFVAGCAAIVLPYEKPGPFAIRITRNWYAPVGGVLMAGCGLYALMGFPLDDVWHRIFGQDVTLWGRPT